jgi:hypothetical protein
MKAQLTKFKAELDTPWGHKKRIEIKATMQKPNPEWMAVLYETDKALEREGVVNKWNRFQLATKDKFDLGPLPRPQAAMIYGTFNDHIVKNVVPDESHAIPSRVAQEGGSTPERNVFDYQRFNAMLHDPIQHDENEEDDFWKRSAFLDPLDGEESAAAPANGDADSDDQDSNSEKEDAGSNPSSFGGRVQQLRGAFNVALFVVLAYLCGTTGVPTPF